MTVVATLTGVLRLDDSNFRSGMRNAKDESNSFGQRMRQAATNVRDFGTSMTVAMAPVAAYLGNAARQTYQFDRNLSNMNAILGITGDEAAALRSELLAYGSGTVAGPMAVSEAYYAIVSGVQDASTHMAILEAATRTSEAGQADLMATTSALITTMNAYGFAADDAAFVSDVFTRTVGMGVVEMDELAASFPQVVSLAARFGISVEEAGASLAFLTTQNSDAARSSTYLTSMITTLLSPTADLSAAITALGYESGAALLEAEGLAGSYQLLSQQNGGLDGLITNTEALQGALGLTDASAAEFFETYMSGVDGATDQAGVIQDQTEQWALLQSQMQGLSIQVGTALMPVLLDLVENYISPAITAVSAWITENPELTGQIVMLTGALVVAGPVIAAVGTAIGFILSPLGIMIVAVGALVAWMNSREGGVIGSLNEARTAAIQLATLGLWALNTAIQWVNDKLAAMGVNLQAIRDQFSSLQTTWGQLGAITGAVTSGDVTFGEVADSFARNLGFGGRAGGGHANAYVPTMVGEREPEVFVPSVSGEIYNQSQLGGMGGMTVQVGAIYANDYEGGRAAARGLNDELNELSRGRGVRTAGA